MESVEGARGTMTRVWKDIVCGGLVAAFCIETSLPAYAEEAPSSSLAEVLTRRVGIPTEEAKLDQERMFGAIAAELRDGGTVQVRGFGTFYLVERKARKGRNPKTGEALQIPAKRYPRFRSSTTLKNLVAKTEGPREGKKKKQDKELEE